MTARVLALVVLLVATALGLLYVFGRTQPIVTVEHSQPVAEKARCEACRGIGYVVCSSCEGSGATDGVQTTCPTCQGSGQVSSGSLLRRTRPDRALGAGRMPCPTCRGSGRSTAARTTCPACDGRGRMSCFRCFGTGTSEVMGRRVWRAARADLSWWERVLSWVGIEPDENAPPQVRSDGSVPLIEHHLRLFETTSRRIEVIEWGDVQRNGAAWEVGVRLRIDEGGKQREEERLVRIQNREVTHVWIAGTVNK